MGVHARASAAYYVAFVVLLAGLAAGLTLFLLLATRPASHGVSYRVAAPVADDCPVGQRATVCYRFDVTNTGDRVGLATCAVTPGTGTKAVFPNGNSTTNVLLSAGETRGVFVNVTAQGTDVVTSPRVACTDA